MENRLEKLLTQIQETRQKRKTKHHHRARRDPIIAEIYQQIMNSIQGKGYKFTRLRIACCILVLTGIRVGDLLPLKRYHLKTLLESG